DPHEIAGNLERVLPRDELLLILTDDPSDEAYFAPIRRAFKTSIMLDAFIHQDPTCAEVLAGLPDTSESALALVSQLVPCRARLFAGTLHSTFTALIHRMRGLSFGDRRFLFLYTQHTEGGPRFEDCEFKEDGAGPYSWNRLRHPVDPSVCSWFREW